MAEPNITQEVFFEMLEKLPDGSFRIKFPKVKSKSGVTFDEHLAEYMTHWKYIETITTSVDTNQIDIPISQDYNEIRITMRKIKPTGNNLTVRLNFNNIYSHLYGRMAINGTQVSSSLNANSIELFNAVAFKELLDSHICEINILNFPDAIPSVKFQLFGTNNQSYLALILGNARIGERVHTLNIVSTSQLEHLMGAGMIVEIWGR